MSKKTRITNKLKLKNYQPFFNVLTVSVLSCYGPSSASIIALDSSKYALAS